MFFHNILSGDAELMKLIYLGRHLQQRQI